MTPTRRFKNILGASAGNFVEWYDWFAYASFAIYFSRAFFPAGDQTAQLLNTAFIFAGGFVARPIGALLFGMYADRRGRRSALILSVTMMCGGSLMIALTPTGLGFVSPLLLIIARLLQGFAVGGEYGASATYVSEMASAAHRGFRSGVLYVTLIGGQLLAMALLVVLQYVLGDEAFYAWGWRLPFVIGAGLAVVVFWIRHGIEETRAFSNTTVEIHARGRPLALLVEYPTANGHRAGSDGRRRDGFLHLRGLYAKAAGEHRGPRPRRGVGAHDQGPRNVAVFSAAVRLGRRLRWT